VSTDANEVLATPDAPNGVIWDRLNDAGITWKDYAFDLPDILLFPNFYQANQDHVFSFDDFLADCANGTLPQVSIVSPGNTAYSEERPNDIQLGEAYSASIVDAVLQSPQWASTALFFTYDEHGGYYDHVPPPPAPIPDDIPPRITSPPDQPGAFDRYGMRVPGFVISPFARADYVSHVVHDHTSILKFIETKWNLEAMTYRDANADDLLDCFDLDDPSPGHDAAGGGLHDHHARADLHGTGADDERIARHPDGAVDVRGRVTHHEATVDEQRIVVDAGRVGGRTPGGDRSGTALGHRHRRWRPQRGTPEDRFVARQVGHGRGPRRAGRYRSGGGRP
jgi:hypothetical protein